MRGAFGKNLDLFSEGIASGIPWECDFGDIGSDFSFSFDSSQLPDWPSASPSRVYPIIKYKTGKAPGYDFLRFEHFKLDPVWWSEQLVPVI